MKKHTRANVYSNIWDMFTVHFLCANVSVAPHPMCGAINNLCVKCAAESFHFLIFFGWMNVRHGDGGAHSFDSYSSKTYNDIKKNNICCFLLFIGRIFTQTLSFASVHTIAMYSYARHSTVTFSGGLRSSHNNNINTKKKCISSNFHTKSNRSCRFDWCVKVQTKL